MTILWRGTADSSYHRTPPAGYAMAWKDYNTQSIVYAPVPLNFLLWDFPHRFWSVVAVIWSPLRRYGIVVPPYEGCLFVEARVEWRPWRWLIG